MGGFDANAVMGDWMLPSPRTIFSTTIDEVAARSVLDTESRTGPHFPGVEEHGPTGKAHHENNRWSQANVSGDEGKFSYRGGLVERMAARAGFNAPRLNTESIKLTDLSKKQEDYLTIPPGLSPTTLLDSPVFLPNSSVILPSPTTGKLSFLQNGNNHNSTLMTVVDPYKGKENTYEDSNASSFSFRHAPTDYAPFNYFNAANKSFPNAGISLHPNNALSSQSSMEPPKRHSENNGTIYQQTNLTKSHPNDNGGTNLLPEQTYNNSIGGADYSPPLDEDGDQKSGGDSNLGGAASEDGYNWRKYGQKHVKGSEYPRSYYKCTYQNCPVKKKVERSHEGHITEIIYKGAHKHPKPPPHRRSAFGPTNCLDDVQPDTEQPGTGPTGGPIWSVMQKGIVDWKPDNLESGSRYELGDGVEKSSTFSNDEDDDEDRATHGSVSLGYNDSEGDELESKRRRVEILNAPDMGSGATRAIREPRVVVQTKSEVDILDDGYRWRKYGQKVVKGNPNPRSYYKCTSPGCNVRKHVERASNDLTSVITTYEGKHNHDVPAARNNGHIASQQPPSAPTNNITNNNIHRSDPSQVRTGATRWFDRQGRAPYCLSGGPQMGTGGHGFGPVMNRPGISVLGLGGLGSNLGEFLPALHSYLGGETRGVSDMSNFVLPKGELKVEPVTDAGLNNTYIGSSVYQQFMTLGP